MVRILARHAGVSFLAALLLAQAPAGAQTPAQPAPAPTPPAPQFNSAITVVGVTPLPGLGVPLSRLPGNVQVASASDLARTPGIHVGAQLGGALASVHLNEAQSSTFQPDVQFRGFAASPLLGLPQGLAVYQDGVRVNEPFGDTVNWDVLPTNAVAGVVMMPGSNPLFGLNALGGALSLQTKTGFSHPGHAARVFSGSFGRQWAELESGGNTGRVAYFAAARWLQEDGWRDFSPSRVAQVFGNLSWQSERSRVAATMTVSTNRLIGNGPAPVQLLEEDRRQVFTHPDETATDIGLFTVTGRRRVRAGALRRMRVAPVARAALPAGGRRTAAARPEREADRPRRRQPAERDEQHLEHPVARLGRDGAGDAYAAARRPRESFRRRHQPGRGTVALSLGDRAGNPHR
jgi:hypothetical protein